MNLDRFKFDSKFTTWLYTIANRTAISFLRKKQYIFEPVEDNQDSGIRLDRDLESEDISRLIGAEIQNLAVEERAVVTLHHVQGCSVDEISGILEKPSGTIKSILFRVRKKLKDRIAPVIDDYTELEGSLT
jgi:RNA polymerase sigma-70 factor (ECF subfamily)